MALIGFGVQILKPEAAGTGSGAKEVVSLPLPSIAAKTAMQVRANGYGVGVSVAAQANPIVLYYYWTGETGEITSGQPWKHQPWNEENFSVFDAVLDAYGTGQHVKIEYESGYLESPVDVITKKKAYTFQRDVRSIYQPPGIIISDNEAKGIAIYVSPIVDGTIGDRAECGALPISRRVGRVQNKVGIGAFSDNEQYILIRNSFQNRLYIIGLCDPGDAEPLVYASAGIYTAPINAGNGEIGEIVKTDIPAPWFNHGGNNSINSPQLDSMWVGERGSDYALVVGNRLYLFRSGSPERACDFYSYETNRGKEPPGELAWMEILEDGTLSGVWHHRRIKTARWYAAHVYVRAQNRNCHDRIYRISGFYATGDKNGYKLQFTSEIAYLELSKDGEIITDFEEEAVGFLPTWNLINETSYYSNQDDYTKLVTTGSTGRYLTVRLYKTRDHACYINQDGSITQPIPVSDMIISDITKSKVYANTISPKAILGEFRGGSDIYLKYDNEVFYKLPKWSFSISDVNIIYNACYVLPTEEVKDDDSPERWKKYNEKEWEKKNYWPYYSKNYEKRSYRTLLTIEAKARHYTTEYTLFEDKRIISIPKENKINLPIYEPPPIPLKPAHPYRLSIQIAAIGGKPGYNGGNFQIPRLRITALGIRSLPGEELAFPRYRLLRPIVAGNGIFTEPVYPGVRLPMLSFAGFAAPGKSSTIDYCLPSIKIQSRKPDFWPINEIRGQIYRLPVLRIKGKGRVQMQDDDWQGYILPRLRVQVRDESNDIDPQDRIAFGGHMRRGWLFRPCPVYGKSIFSPAVLSLHYTMPLQASIQAEGRPPLTAEDTADAEWWVLKFHREEMF